MESDQTANILQNIQADLRTPPEEEQAAQVAAWRAQSQAHYVRLADAEVAMARALNDAHHIAERVTAEWLNTWSPSADWRGNYPSGSERVAIARAQATEDSRVLEAMERYYAAYRHYLIVKQSEPFEADMALPGTARLGSDRNSEPDGWSGGSEREKDS